jgi:hypothetical protein
MHRLPYLETNLYQLQKSQKDFWGWLSSQPVDSHGVASRLRTNGFGKLDWLRDTNAFLLEPFADLRMYHKWYQLDRPEKTATIVVGCNLGYGINTLLSNTPKTHTIMVLEPDPNVLHATLGLSNYRSSLQNNKLLFIPPVDDVWKNSIEMISIYMMLGEVYLRVDLPSMQMSQEYAAWGKRLDTLINNRKIQWGTFRRKQDTMVANEIGNFNRAFADGSLSRMKGRGKDITAVILGAGPSLNTYLPYLKQSPGNAVYATALQTLPALQAHGFKPHFCLAIDYQPVMLKVYKRLDCEWAKNIPLIYSAKVVPELVERYPGPTLPLWTAGGLGTHFRPEKEIVINTAGNVGVGLIRLLKAFGTKHFVLAGQDFAWKDDKMHAQGHINDDRSFSYSAKKHIKITNSWNETIYTSRAFSACVQELESELQDSCIRIWNLYGGGMSIQGTEEVTWNELQQLELLQQSPHHAGRFLKALHSSSEPAPKPKIPLETSKWIASIHAVLKRLNKLFKKTKLPHEAIRQTFKEVYLFLNQNPLYSPYIYNEIIDIYGLIHLQSKYDHEDLSRCKKILSKVLKKLKYIDRELSAPINPQESQRKGEELIA